jgi:hypothetical protein
LGDAMLLIVLVSGIFNAALGFALAVYLERRHQAFVVGGMTRGGVPPEGPSAANPPVPDAGSPAKPVPVAQSAEGPKNNAQPRNQPTTGAESQPCGPETAANGDNVAVDQAAISDMMAAGKPG